MLIENEVLLPCLEPETRTGFGERSMLDLSRTRHPCGTDARFVVVLAHPDRAVVADRHGGVVPHRWRIRFTARLRVGIHLIEPRPQRGGSAAQLCRTQHVSVGAQDADRTGHGVDSDQLPATPVVSKQRRPREHGTTRRPQNGRYHDHRPDETRGPQVPHFHQMRGKERRDGKFVAAEPAHVRCWIRERHPQAGLALPVEHSDPSAGVGQRQNSARRVGIDRGCFRELPDDAPNPAGRNARHVAVFSVPRPEIAGWINTRARGPQLPHGLRN